MKRVVYLFITLVPVGLVLSGFLFPTACAAEEKADPAVEAKIQETMRSLGADLSQPIKSDRVTTRRLSGAPTRDIETARREHFGFDPATGELLAYYTLEEIDSVPRGLTKADAISEEKAFAAAQAFAKAVGANVEFARDSLRYEDTAEESPGDLMGAEYSVMARREYQGVPYLESAVRVTVSAYSGHILSYSNHVVRDVPASMEARLTAEEAEQKAREFLAQKIPGGKPDQFTTQHPPQKMIAHPNGMFSGVPGNPNADGVPPTLMPTPGAKPLLCWIVRLSLAEDEAPIMLLVDAATGEIVGGIA